MPIATPLSLRGVPRRVAGRRGVLLCAPFHSTSNPPVGLAYLRSWLASHDVEAQLIDLNIEARDALLSEEIPGIPDNTRDLLVAQLFMQSRRSYLGEALTWAWHDDNGIEAVVDRVDRHPSPLVHRFWDGLGVERLAADRHLRIIGERLNGWFNSRIAAVALADVDFVGLSLTVSNVAASRQAAALLRAARPDLLIVLGGPHVSHRNARDLLRLVPTADAAVPAPAFHPLLDLLARRADDAVAGAWVRSDGDLVGDEQAWWPRLEDLPFADWSTLDFSRYDPAFDVSGAHGAQQADRRTIPLQTSRGCSYAKCEFCHNVVDHPRYLLQTAPRVIREVVHQRAALGTNNFFFTDDEFNGSRRRTIELGQMLAEAAPGIRFFAWLRLDKIDGDVLSALYAGGCRDIFVGVEAVDDALLTAMVKGYSADLAMERLRCLASFAAEHDDFRFSFNLICDHPEESLESAASTLRTVCEEPELFVGRVAALCRYHLYEGTPGFARYGAGSVGCLEPLVPPGLAMDSFRYLTPAQERPDREERMAIWRAVGEITCGWREGVSRSAAGPGPAIYD